MSSSESIFDLLHKAVDHGENFGASFVEARYDDLTLSTLNLTNDIVTQASTIQRKGIGIFAYFEGTPGYSFTPNLKVDEIKNATERAVKIARSTASMNEMKFDFENMQTIKDRKVLDVKIHPKDTDITEKIEMLKTGVANIKEQVDAKSTTGLFGELWGEKYFSNSEKSEIYWTPLVTQLLFLSVAKGPNGQAVGMDSKGVSKGLEFYTGKYSPETLGTNTGKYCKEQLTAVAPPSGKHKVYIGAELGGVLAHESFGHLTETDFVVTGMSPLSNKVGEMLGSEHATIIDTGVIDDGFYLPYDDQGMKTKEVVLLDKGKFLGYLHDRGSAKQMGVKPTGNSRAIHFMFQPIPRMKNTYFASGDYSDEEALELVKNGVRAIGTSGGEVSLDGNFLFNCKRGYLIEESEITTPIRNASLSGNIMDFIKQVAAATKEIEMGTGYFGGCGKSGQAPLPVGLGGANIVVNEVLIGGGD
ncbi:MAG: TldD/PmbA family protein [Promethearchaeota archaeon]